MVQTSSKSDRRSVRAVGLAEYGRAEATGHLCKLIDVLRLVPSKPLGQAVQVLLEARAAGRRVYVMGNGGSATTASHLACDLMKTAQVEHYRPLRVMALTDSVPLLTAWANDVDYSCVFANQIATLVDPDDVVIAISASGNSPNIVAGLKAAEDAEAYTIALVGFDGGEASKCAQVTILIESYDYGLVEDAHLAIGHALTAALGAVVRAEARDQPEERPILAWDR